jgi:hypothetical protein
LFGRFLFSHGMGPSTMGVGNNGSAWGTRASGRAKLVWLTRWNGCAGLRPTCLEAMRGAWPGTGFVLFRIASKSVQRGGLVAANEYWGTVNGLRCKSMADSVKRDTPGAREH